MNVLIVFCHPSKDSYTSQILEQIKSVLLTRKINFEISDLYAINFQSDMTEQEYLREAFSNPNLQIPDDVKIEHEKLNWADSVIFIYPVWWSNCPAKLKGWFDRVYSVGYAYKHNDSFAKMKNFHYGAIICTAGYSNDILIETGIAQSMQTIMLNDKLGDRFKNKEMFILGGTLEIEKVREKHTKQLIEMISRMNTTSPNTR